MIETDELQQRILAELQEAGFDDLHGTLNTVIDPTGSSEEIDRFRDALEALTQRGLGYLNFERINTRQLVRLSQEETSDFLANLGSWFRYDREQRYWTLGNGDPLIDQYPVLFLTRSGIEEANKILARRGYQWWAPR